MPFPTAEWWPDPEPRIDTPQTNMLSLEKILTKMDVVGELWRSEQLCAVLPGTAHTDSACHSMVQARNPVQLGLAT